MWDEFRRFILRGNAIDMAVGIVIGAAFTAVVNSLVKDVIMPPIGLLTNGLSFTDIFINLGPGEYDTLAAAQEAGAPTVNIGLFVNNLLSLLIVGFVVFLMIKGVNRLSQMQDQAEETAVAGEPETKTCPECLSQIPAQASRCAFCAVVLTAPIEM